MMILDRAHKLAGVYRALLADVWSELDASAQLAPTQGVTGGMGLAAGYDPLDVGAIGYVVTEQNVGKPRTPDSEVHRRVELGYAKDPRADPEFFLSAGQVERGLGVFRRDLSPVVTQVLRIKLRNWITGLVAEDLRLLSARLQEHDARASVCRSSRQVPLILVRCPDSPASTTSSRSWSA